MTNQRRNKNNKLNELVPLKDLKNSPIYRKGNELIKYDPEKRYKSLDERIKELEESSKKKSSEVLDKYNTSGKKTKFKSPVIDFNKILQPFISLFNKKVKMNNKEDNESVASDEGVKIVQRETILDLFKKDDGNTDYESLGYPKKVKIPVDIEILENEKNLYFNVEKWLDYRHLFFVKKIIPIHILDKLTYNRSFFDKFAPKLHDEAVEYNLMTPKEQYAFDKKMKKKGLAIISGGVMSVGLLIFLMIIPSQLGNDGLSKIRSGNYQDAYSVYNSITTPSKLDNFYKQYALSMGYAQAGNYEKAKEELLKLEGYSAPPIDLNDSMSEILYQEANYLMEQKQYAKAAENLKITYNYKDSKSKFLEASYMSLDELMNENKFEEAMKMLSLVGNYKDSATKGRNFMEKLYQEAQDKYRLGLFSEAEKLFYYVAQNNYKDSKTMIYQAQYNAGLIEYKNKNYDKAIEQLSKIEWFKDSSAMLADMYYTKGKALLDSNPVIAYESFINSLNHRDTVNIIQQPKLVLYGEWAVQSFNGSYVSDLSLKFDSDNLFTSNNPESVYLKGIALSNNNKNKYNFAGEQFETPGNNYKIKVVTKDINNISLMIGDGNVLNELTLRRVASINKTNLDVFSSVRDSLYKYIDKKLNIGG